MNTVQARVWKFRLENGSEVVANVLGQGHLPVDLARLVHVNAMACDLRRALDYRTKQLEVSLLLSYLDTTGGQGPLKLDHHAFAASSRHIRGFVSECSGLGMLTAAGEALFAWQDGNDSLHSFDALPKQLLRHYNAEGVRPDLLFHLPAGLVAGEARGRHRGAQELLPKKPLAPQKDRLRELAAWSQNHSSHDYFMSWVWIGHAGVAVDIFLPEVDRWDIALTDVWVDGNLHEDPGIAEDESTQWRFPLQSRPLLRRPEISNDLREHDSALDADAEDIDLMASTFSGLTEARHMGTPQEQAEEVATGLFRSAPEPAADAVLAGIPVRGNWVPADQLGPARHEVFLGVLAERAPVPVNFRERLTRTEGRFDACLDGRLLTVVRPIATPVPTWSELAHVLLNNA
ncbi:hypothetical protein [Streptomyces sp. NBC_01244]|uniref:hypothetical protein n=1 Tax=Streptomyces sp. NBC_01244 TaxID=2903797 RepID=UPI002E13FD10|nr:hypothetical protein OG247_23870 [Streptomyces sp. NBC_01244]